MCNCELTARCCCLHVHLGLRSLAGGHEAGKSGRADSKITPTSRSGKPLLESKIPRSGFRCDVCGTGIAQGETAFSCRADDFDMCSRCWDQLSSAGDGKECALVAASSNLPKALKNIPKNGVVGAEQWVSRRSSTSDYDSERGHWLEWKFESAATVQSVELYMKRYDSYAPWVVEVHAEAKLGSPRSKVGGATLGRGEYTEMQWVPVSLSETQFTAEKLRLYIKSAGSDCLLCKFLKHLLAQSAVVSSLGPAIYLVWLSLQGAGGSSSRVVGCRSTVQAAEAAAASRHG